MPLGPGPPVGLCYFQVEVKEDEVVDRRGLEVGFRVGEVARGECMWSRSHCSVMTHDFILLLF